VARSVEADKIVRSVARFLAGLKPKYGSAYYFDKHTSVVNKILTLKASIKGYECPFCRRKFRRVSSFVTHLVTIHYHDILVYIGKEYLVEPATK
jgi:hypothetical protein